ncbi:AI-2E family transporter [Candidatus Erwinia haradaeae]|uniref:AI-2E transporter family protein n=1 Tax=Candidatus Erwinia haradaeae TaxID=1922217 RepID=A0A451D1K9_9GAMM|nr:AI-2E family transporter [Candidatus Erwinia haradaeae]VFP79491.1 AI-2E transporter family protein [Candidatus Erwinia haradaeae]
MEKRHANYFILCKIASFILIFSALLAIFPLNLLPCFLAGFIIYEVIIGLTFLIEYFIQGQIARWISIIIFSIMSILIMTFGIKKIIEFFMHDFQNLSEYYSTVNQLLQNIQHTLSLLITNFLPLDNKELQGEIITFVHKNLAIKTFGGNAAHTVATILIGIILGIMISLHKKSKDRIETPLKKEILNRLRILSDAFHNVICAQINVSFCNTLLTGCFLFWILPLCGLHFPFSKTLILLTFLTGLLPIIGNLISNTVIVLIGLSISLKAALISLIYLILVHKLEYFINARIFSSCINANTWEILLAMLVFESTFGLSGVIAAPIYYAYIKAELRRSCWI